LNQREVDVTVRQVVLHPTQRIVSSSPMDVLLRLIRDLPGSLEYLREHAA
jgi:hypothetical protein